MPSEHQLVIWALGFTCSAVTHWHSLHLWNHWQKCRRWDWQSKYWPCQLAKLHCLLHLHVSWSHRYTCCIEKRMVHNAAACFCKTPLESTTENSDHKLPIKTKERRKGVLFFIFCRAGTQWSWTCFHLFWHVLTSTSKTWLIHCQLLWQACLSLCNGNGTS